MAFEEPARIRDLLSDYNGTWAVAGGWAIDLFLNRETRDHQDIEIAIPRSEQLKLQAFLKHWNLKYIVDGKFHDWTQGLHLELPIHEIHGEDEHGRGIEILFNEIEGNVWRFRRNLLIEYPLSKALAPTNSKIPALSPEVVLLYKAKWNEHKDYSDFVNVLPEMNTDSKHWLKEAIITNHGTHEWLDLLG